MAAKVSIQDIEDGGFRAQQFGTPADWSEEAGGYLARVIAHASAWARARIGGAAYDVPGEIANQYIRSAELCWCRAELWRRRAAFIDSNAVSALDNLVHADRREFEAQAARAMECAEDNIVMALGDGSVAGSALAFVSVETGPFLSSGALPGSACR